jgi:Tol biopolymer transport system component
MRQIRHFLTVSLTFLALAGCAGQQHADGDFWMNHFVFVSSRSGSNDIYLSDMQGRQVRALTRDVADDATPRVGMDGKIIFASRRTGTWQIYSMNWDGSEQIALTREPAVNNYRPFPAPDGRILFVSDRMLKPHVFSMNVDGTDVRQLTQGSTYNDYPVVGEDGHIYFTSSRSSKWEIWKMGPDGSSPQQMTHTTRNVQEIALVSPAYPDLDNRFTNRTTMLPVFGFYTQPRIIFSASSSDGRTPGLYRMNRDGSDFRELTANQVFVNRSPVVWPNGRVFFTSDRAGSTDVWSMSPDGRDPRQMIADPAYDSTS